MKLQELFFGNQSREQRLTQGLQCTTDQRGDESFMDDILNFNEDCPIEDGNDTITGNFINSSSSTALDKSNSSERRRQNFTDDQLSSGICVPSDALADLEWLSNVVVEDLFSSEDLQKLELISGAKSVSPEDSSQSNQDSQHLSEKVSHRAKARSKRPRNALAHWRSRILDTPIKSPQRKTPPSSPSSSSATTSNPSVVRKCLHCATEKTPQWRTGPQGPKTLCNACGVRYKSGRLVPEYRPASSPTFVLTKHSNSHRKVQELQRQNELQRSQQQQFLHPNSFFEVSGGQEYLIQQEPNFPETM